VLGSKLPLFFGLVILLSALLLFVIFRSLVIPLQARADESAHDRIGAGRHRPGLSARMVRERPRSAEGADRGVGAGHHVRGGVRPLDGLRGPVGARHAEANRGSVEIDGEVELRPALNSREMHEAFGGLAAEGKTTARGAPKNPLQLGATLWHFRHESRVTSPPIWAQNLILPPLCALGRMCGVRPYHDRWDSRTRS
jgi:hypothetical protein